MQIEAAVPSRSAPRLGRAHYYPEVPDAEWSDWRWQFRHRVTSLEALAKHLEIPAEEWHDRLEVLRDFRMGITPYYLSLIDKDDPDDPILRQVVPLAEENLFRAVGEEDPLGEEQFSPVPGITHRYPDRVLMVVSNNCAVYCRYCTRKRTMYEGATPDIELDRMVDYIARTPAVRDVVVSGGDPLNYSTAKLEQILSKLRAIPHLEIIRIGSRVPVALPQRIDDELCTMLAKYHPLWINVHFNHPRELTPEAAAACDRLSRAGIPLNNQAVLLKGVNDSVETIRALCHGLMRMRVRPYYLYQCDPVRGAEHFRTPISKGLEIIEGLRGHTSGLAIPTYVIDAPGGGGKVPVAPQYLLHYDREKGRAVLRNFQGNLYEYFEPRRDNDELHPEPQPSGGRLVPSARAAEGAPASAPPGASPISHAVPAPAPSNGALNGHHAVNGHAGNGHAGNGHAGNGHAGNGHVGNGHVGNGHVSNGHVGNGHVGNGHVGNGHVSNGHVGNGHVGNGHVGNGHVGNGHVGNGHVGNGHVGNGHVGNGHVGNGHAGNGHAGNGHAGNGHRVDADAVVKPARRRGPGKSRGLDAPLYEAYLAMEPQAEAGALPVVGKSRWVHRGATPRPARQAPPPTSSGPGATATPPSESGHSAV